MEKHYQLVFDKIIRKQLVKAAKNNNIKSILTKMLDQLEILGPLAGDLLDSQLHLYECKTKRPPLRLYYKVTQNEIYIFLFEMKTRPKKQKDTISRLKKYLKS